MKRWPRRGTLVSRRGGAASGECGDRVERVLIAASVGITLSPSARVVVLLKSDLLAYYC
jgi:hypothetical protein